MHTGYKITQRLLEQKPIRAMTLKMMRMYQSQMYAFIDVAFMLWQYNGAGLFKIAFSLN
jgi:hypothetical protein